MKILFAWIGTADHMACEDEQGTLMGPIGNAVEQLQFDELVLIQNNQTEETSFSEKGKSYVKWIQKTFKGKVSLYLEDLKNPTDLNGIYKITNKVLREITINRQNSELTFHLSPGTWAMAVVWVILSETKYVANLLQSSPEDGVKQVRIPFELNASRLPDIYRPNKSEIQRIREIYPLKGLSTKIAKTNKYNFPILIESEKGCDQQHLAQTIYLTGPRQNEQFVARQCDREPFNSQEEFESLIKDTHKGVLFLAKVEQLTPDAQSLLTSYLDTYESGGKISPSYDGDVRIIAGTNVDLKEIIKNGTFSEDLYYLLSGITLKIPPLRERPSEIITVAKNMLKSLDNKKTLSDDAKNTLKSHAWPGNDRELGSTLRRIVTFSAGDIISDADVYDGFFGFQKNLTNKSDILGRNMESGLDLQAIIGEVTRHYISRAIKLSNGNKPEAAKLVGMSNYQTLSNWIKKYEIS